MSTALHRGFTLIELLVAVSISVILLLLALPAFTTWVADGEIRNGTESIASGIRFAQGTAISQNRNAQFVLAGGGWNVAMVDTPLVFLQSATFGEGQVQTEASNNVIATGETSRSILKKVYGR